MILEATTDTRVKFDEGIRNLISNKRADNSSFLSTAEYNRRLRALKVSKRVLEEKGSKKTMTDYRMVRRFAILSVNNEERLVRPIDKASAEIRYYVTNEQLYDILRETHLALGHGGRNRMKNELRKKYCNITAEAIMVYLNNCVHCQKKTRTMKRGSFANPVLHSCLL